jgi:hypothetical protein
MPKSRIRKKVKEERTVQAQVVQSTPEPTESPRWLAPVMLAMFLLGLAWIVVYYISGSQLPLGKMFPEVDIDAWNIVVGFGLLMVGFGMSTRWK